MADSRAQSAPSPSSSAAPAVRATPAGGWLTPERVAHAEFRTGFRGLDSTEVRSFLARVASELRTMLDREAELVARLETAEERNTVLAPAPLDIRQVSEMLGQEAARVLTTAREAAADITARAEADAEALAEAAAVEAARLRGMAELVLAERTAEAEAAAATILERAEAAAAAIGADAQEAADRARAEATEAAAVLAAEAEELTARAEADAAATRDAARDEGRRMVAEARAVRERILTDMARRRNVARQQLERVRAARERLLEAIDGVRQGVVEVQAELSGSLVDAKLAGERAARTVDVDEIPTMVDLDAEVEMAKDTGLVDVAALLARDEDLSTLDTGEFAAVTVIEPAVDHPAASDASESVADEPEPEPVADAVVAADAVADASEPVADVVTPEVAEPIVAEGSSAAAPAQADDEAVIDVRDGQADAAPTEAAELTPTGAGAADGPSADATGTGEAGEGGGEGGGGAGAGGKARSGRKTRSPKKAEELFARLRAADEGGSPAEAAATGAAVVVGLAAADAGMSAAGASGESEPSPAAGSDAAASDAGSADVADPDRVVLHTRDALLAPTVRDLNRQLKLALSDQQNQLLEAGRNADGKEPARAPEASEMIAVYVAAARDELAGAFLSGRRSVRPEDRTAAESVDVDAHTAELADAVVVALRQRLSAGSDEAGPDQELWPVDRVRSAYREVRSQRLAELVEFAVFSAYAAGQLAAAPSGAQARWVCDACGPDCLDNALAGPQELGTIYPTGHAAPPAFAGCRCALVVVDAS